MGSCMIFTEVTAVIGKGFLSRIAKFSELETLRKQLCEETGVYCNPKNDEHTFQIKGGLDGINKAFAFLQAMENNLQSLIDSHTVTERVFIDNQSNTGHISENVLSNQPKIDKSHWDKCLHLVDSSVYNIKNMSISEEPDNCTNANAEIYLDQSVASFPLKRSSISNIQKQNNIPVLPPLNEVRPLQVNTKIKDCQESKQNLIVNKHLEAVIHREPTGVTESHNHDTVENLLQCLAEDKATNVTSGSASPRNLLLDYSTLSFQRADEETFVATEEIFEYGTMCLSDIITSDDNNRNSNLKESKERSQMSRNSLNGSDKTNSINTLKETGETVIKNNIGLIEHQIVHEAVEEQYTTKSSAITVRKEDLDTLDKMLESIHKNIGEHFILNSPEHIGNIEDNCNVDAQTTSTVDQKEISVTKETNSSSDSVNLTIKSKASDDLYSVLSHDKSNGGKVMNCLDNVSVEDIANIKIYNDQNMKKMPKKKENIPNNACVNEESLGVKCSQCVKWFKRKKGLKKHVKTVHCGVKFECNVAECGKNFVNKAAMERHINVVHRGLQCSTCKVVFKSLESKDKHSDLCEQLKMAIPTCGICGKTYATVSNLNKHEKTHDKANRVQCELCKKWYSCNVSLKDHTEIVHKMFDCNYCDDQILGCDNYETHMTNMHSALVKTLFKRNGIVGSKKKPLTRSPAVCHYCSKTFASRSNLGHHIRSVHEKKKLKCADCEKTFSTRDHLQRHHKVAHEKLDYPCPMCNIVYPNRVTLARHQKEEHHQLMMDQCYQCEICGHTFMYSATLDRHIQRDHKGLRYQCQKCDLQFSSKYLRDEHIQVEHEGKRWQCKQCPITFLNKFRLKYHVSSMHGENGPLQFSCDSCGKTFKSKTKLKYHKKRRLCNDSRVVKANTLQVLENERNIQNEKDEQNDNVNKIEDPMTKTTLTLVSSAVYDRDVTEINKQVDNNVTTTRIDPPCIVNHDPVEVHTCAANATPTDILKSALETHGIGPNSVLDNFVPVDFHSAFNVSHNSLVSPQHVPNHPGQTPSVMYNNKDDSCVDNSFYTTLLLSAENSIDSHVTTMQHSQLLGQYTNPDYLL